MNKKSISLFLVLFLAIFLVLGNIPSILADDNNSNSGSSNSGSDDENDDEDDNENKIRERFTRGDCTIRAEIEVKVEDGKRVETIKRKMECANGIKEEIKIRIENRTEGGVYRERIKYEFRGEELEVEAEEGIEIEEEIEGAEYKLKARWRNGNFTNVTDIKIMPDQASEIALERLKALNFKIELREVRHKNIPRVVYHIESNKTGRFLGIFKFAMKVDGQVDPETGEFIGISKPWWAFLVAGEDDDETGDDEGNETNGGNETNTTITNITINLEEQNESGESGIAKLEEMDGEVWVTINTTGFVENVSQPAHIHVGVCPDVGSVVYPLENVVNGYSVTVLNTTFAQMMTELPLGLNLHKSIEEVSVYTSCGDIEF